MSGSARGMVVACICLGLPAGAVEANTGMSLGFGVYPGSLPNGLVDASVDLELDEPVTPVLAASLTVLATPSDLLALTALTLGLRWHCSPVLAVGVAGTGGVALFPLSSSVPRLVAGLTAEALRWTVIYRHELGLTVVALWPVDTPTAAFVGPRFSVLVLPKVSWTYRF